MNNATATELALDTLAERLDDLVIELQEAKAELELVNARRNYLYDLIKVLSAEYAENTAEQQDLEASL